MTKTANFAISEQANEVIIKHKKSNNFNNKNDALEDILLKFKKDDEK